MITPRSRTARVLLGWVAVAIGALVVLALRSPASAQTDRLSGADAARAQERYQVVCATCHGGAAQGGPVPGTDRTAPALTDTSAAYVDLVIRTGRMPPPADPFDNRERRVALDEDERERLVAWMTEEFGLEPGLPEPGEGDIAEGFAAYQQHCAHCHGASGQGGVAGAGAWTPNIAVHEPQVVLEAIRVGPFEMPAFSTDQIDEAQADGIAAYLEEVGGERGTPVLGLVEMNPVTASAFVALLALAVVFSLLFIAGRATWFPDAVAGRPQPDPAEEAAMTDTGDEGGAAPAPVPPSNDPPTYDEAGLQPMEGTDDADIEQPSEEEGFVSDPEETGKAPKVDPEYDPVDAEGRPDPLATPGPTGGSPEDPPEVRSDEGTPRDGA